jgi:hypothetical protein
MRRTALLAAIGSVALGCQPTAPTGDAPKRTRDQFAEGRTDDGAQKAKFGEDRVTDPDPKPTPFDGERAIKYLKQICDLGPRVSGSDGMKRQQEVLIKHFEGFGGKVVRQEFKAQQKSQKDPVPMTNLVVSWFPERKARVILCCHYDTRPFADQEGDRKSWSKPFVSANDGTSGVAFLMELAHHMKDFPTAVGVDFVIFDGEEYVFRGPEGDDDYFLGSSHFAKEYQASEKTRGYKYTAAILLDLFAHDGAKLRVEGFSWGYSRELVMEVWKAAADVKAKSFVEERGYKRAPDGAVQDDHLPLIQVGIPAIDVIDFDYDHWHKLTDTPDKCSPKQMAEVAKVLTVWLKRQK